MGHSEEYGDELKEITQRTFICVEGRDEVEFVCNAIRAYNVQGTQIEDFGGINDLRGFLKLLRVRPGFSRLKRLLVIRDAEKSADRAVQSVCDALYEGGFLGSASGHKNRPPNSKLIRYRYSTFDRLSVGVVILPWEDAQEGTLEDLCLAMIKDEMQASLDLAQDFTERAAAVAPLRHPHKSRLHAYLSIHDKCVGMKIGEAAKLGAWDWQSPKAASLRRMLEALGESRETC